MKTLKKIFEQLEQDPIIAQKTQQLNQNSQELQKQVDELNVLLRKKSIDDSEYKKRMELVNRQLKNEKMQSQKNRVMQNAANRTLNKGNEQRIDNV